MELQSVQTADIGRALERQESLVVDSSKVDQDFLTAYDWLVTQMQARLSLATKPSYPWWAWKQYGEEGFLSQDEMRTYGPPGTAMVELRLEVPDTLVTLTDFDLWHSVLNHWYLPQNEADLERFFLEDDQCSDPKTRHRLEQEIEQSWELIFDLDFYDDYITYPPEEKFIQACFFELKPEHVTHLRYFTACELK